MAIDQTPHELNACRSRRGFDQEPKMRGICDIVKCINPHYSPAEYLGFLRMVVADFAPVSPDAEEFAV